MTYTFKEVGTKSPNMVAYFDELRALGVTESDISEISILICQKVAKTLTAHETEQQP